MLRSASQLIPSGLLPVFKPKGVTSADVVEEVKRHLKKGARIAGHTPSGIKVGHGGILIP